MLSGVGDRVGISFASRNGVRTMVVFCFLFSIFSFRRNLIRFLLKQPEHCSFVISVRRSGLEQQLHILFGAASKELAGRLGRQI